MNAGEKTALNSGPDTLFFKPEKPGPRKVLIALAGFLGLIIFSFDLALPLGVAGGVPYVTLVLFGLWFRRHSWIIIFALVSSALLVAGYLLSPEGGIPWMTLTNRFLAFFAIWVTALLLSLKTKTDETIRTQTITSRIAKAIESTLEPRELFKIIAREIHRAVPDIRLSIGRNNSTAEKYSFYFREKDKDSDSTPKLTGQISRIVYETKRPHNIPNLQVTQWEETRLAKLGYRNSLTIPILQGDQCIAHIILNSREPAYFTSEHEELLTAISSHLGAAIKNAHLHEEVEKRAERLKILNELSRKISQNLKLEEALDSVARASMELTRGNKSRIFLLDERTETFKLCVSHGQIAGGENHSFKPGQGLIGTVAKTGEPLIIPNIQNDPRSLNVEWAREHNLQACIAVPVHWQGKPFVVINCFSNESDFFGGEDLELLNALASQMGTVIEKANLIKEAGDHAARQEITANIAKTIGSTLEPEKLFNAIIDEIRRVVPSDRILIAKLKSEKDDYSYYFDDTNISPGPSQKIVHSTGRIARVVYKTKQPHRIPNLLEPPWDETLHAKSGYRSALVIPILQDDQCIAHMHLSSKKTNFFTPDHENLLTAISSHLEAAIQNAHLHEEAQRSRNFFRSVVADNADAILAVNIEHKITHWNKGAENLLGYSGAEMMGKTAEKLVPEDGQHVLKKSRNKVFKEGKSSHFEAMRLHKNGSQVPVSVTISPVNDENGNTIGACAIYKDLTERMENEKRLKFALEEAEEGSHAKSEFLSTMSHELRSPLNSVIGFSDLIMRDAEEKDEMTRQLVPKIRDSGKYLLTMIEEILDLDRIEAGKVTLKLEAIAINDLTGAVVDSWHARLPEEFSMSLERDPTCDIVHCDSTRVGQVLNNLIDNAIKYSPEGGAICVRTLSSPGEIQISVHDEGMGMKPEELETIFDRFHQLESGYTRRAGGLGIGLALARNLLEMHGGRIWVESGEGKGSTFTLALPNLQENITPTGVQEANEWANPSNGNPWSERKILIVDDMDHYHEFMKYLMKDATRLAFAFNGVEAIESANRERPDLILMDLRMPVMDGFEAIQRLKADP